MKVRKLAEAAGDIAAFLGLAAVGVGVAETFGLFVALIVVGALLVAAAVLGVL